MGSNDFFYVESFLIRTHLESGLHSYMDIGIFIRIDLETGTHFTWTPHYKCREKWKPGSVYHGDAHFRFHHCLEIVVHYFLDAGF